MAAKPNFSDTVLPPLTEEVPATVPVFKTKENQPLFAPHLSGVSSYMGYQANSNLMGANLEDADLRWNNLRGINFSQAKLTHAKLWGCCLSNAQFNNADLTGADLTGADLMGASLEEACLDNTCLVGARYDSQTRFPKNFGSPDSRGMVFHDEHQGNDSDFGF